MFSEVNLLPKDGVLKFYRDFIPPKSADDLFENLKTDINWKQEGMRIFGKYVDFPRLTAWYGDEGKAYVYSGLKNEPQPFTTELNELKRQVEAACNQTFNSVLLNYYRTGKDSMGWHADNEPELGLNPTIASISLGITRKFQLKHKNMPGNNLSFFLNHGSLLIMSGVLQHHWLHQIPKETIEGERINLTFRYIN